MSQGDLLLVLATHLVLTGLPGVAATLLAARNGVRSVPVLLAVGLAATGLVAMVAFWAYFAGKTAGQTFSFFILFGAVAATVWVLWERKIEGELLRALAVPLALWALGSLFIVFLGFAHGGIDSPIATSAPRFTAGALPSDSGIPFFYAEYFYANGHHGTPPVFPGEWLSSDRPPLQVGYVLAQRPFYFGDGIVWNELHYQVLGVVLQQLWIVGLWALMLAARVQRVTRALILVTVLVSGFALTNGFFVWPKLLPAAMLLAAAALVITPLWDEVRTSLWGGALVAALAGIAMLGHGSSIFGLIPLAILAAYRGVPNWRWLAVAVAVGIAFMAPWSAFQKYEDPPGNRLTKWMLAGYDQIDDRGTLEAIVDGYSEAGLGGTIDNKAENFEFMVGGEPAWQWVEDGTEALFDGDGDLAAKNARNIEFFYLLPELGLLLVVPLLMLIWRRRGREEDPDDWRFALACLLVSAIGAIAWGLILFGNLPARTVVHAGTYLIPILLFAGTVAGLRAVLPRVALGLVGLNCLLMLVVYVPSLEPPPGSSYSTFAFLLAALGLAGSGWLALRSESR